MAWSWKQRQLDGAYAVQAYLEGEDVGPRECSRCQEAVPAKKKLQLWSAPEVLVLTLKRFRCINKVSKKVGTFVEYLVQGWDISHYIRQPQVNGVTHRLVVH